MTPTTATTGGLARIIRNEDGLYEGDLVYYARIVFNHARNLRHPYHNARHMFHVLWLCYQACEFYAEVMTRRQMRDLLIAALFHDFDHSGMVGNDDLNIERAIRGLKKYALEEDQGFYLEDSIALMRATEFPHKPIVLSLPAQIVRDADMSQAMSVAWIQQVVIGLATEWDMDPIDVLRMQGGFHSSLKFHTDWARQMFPQSEIDAKIQEAAELLEIFAPSPAGL